LDNIDVPYATTKGIKVLNVPGSNAATVAEHTIGLMLSLMRKMHKSINEVKDGNWNYRNSYDGDELRGKTLGIIGMGEIGHRVARLGEAFGMQITYWNRSSKDVSFEKLDLESLCRRAHVISLHTSLSNETRGIISRELIRKMDQHPILINTARGALVDERALIEAVLKGQIAGYSADVLEEQPPRKDHPFLKIRNVEITPHAASLTRTTFNEMCLLSVKNTIALLNGQLIDTNFIFNKI
jgi:D-3-phosphoglycerate dehydrogenase